MPHVIPWLVGASIVQGMAAANHQQNANNAAAANAASQQTALDQQILNLFQGPMGEQVKHYFMTAMSNPESLLSSIFGQQQNVLGNQIEQTVANFRNQFGSAMPNEQAQVKDLYERGLMERADLGSAEMAQAQQLQQSGATGLEGFMQAFAQALGGISGQYAQAGSQIAANQQNAGNPMAGLISILAQNPNLFGGAHASAAAAPAAAAPAAAASNPYTYVPTGVGPAPATGLYNPVTHPMFPS